MGGGFLITFCQGLMIKGFFGHPLIGVLKLFVFIVLFFFFRGGLLLNFPMVTFNFSPN